jgi:hypothetical protein
MGAHARHPLGSTTPGGGLRKSAIWAGLLPFLLPFPVISCSIPVFLRHVGSHPRHQLIISICSIMLNM